ncbi:MAG: ABC transporter substrate-binding protein [Actinophytocola sp.]|uniref:ABC transporter substrate-binding protein n=1 Tax=Actinophytocola sp. TaxID=1872138 RepID=UPI003D6BE296
MRRHLAVLLLSTALLATSCSAEDGEALAPSLRRPDQVTVGVIPILDVAPIYLGQREGFFLERDIKLNLKSEVGGADVILGVISQKYQIGFSNVTSLLLAQSNGVPVKMVSNGCNSTGTEGDFAALMVRGDSPIKSPVDLEGKTVATNTLQNIVDTSVRASVRNAGGDPKKVKFAAVPFPEMPAALQEGQVDAVFVVEPFQQAVLADGGRKVASSYVDTAPNLTVATYFTGLKQQVDNPDLIRRFADAMAESLAYADSHPDEARAIISTYTEIDPAVIDKLTLPKWPAKVNRESMQTLADLALEDGLLKEPAFVDALFP